MYLKIADRMKDYEEGIFQLLNEKKEKVERQGIKVYNLPITPHGSALKTCQSPLPKALVSSLMNIYAMDGELLKKTKFMIVSYPSNPVCRIAPDSFYEELIPWAKRYSFPTRKPTLAPV